MNNNAEDDDDEDIHRVSIKQGLLPNTTAKVVPKVTITNSFKKKK